MPELNDYDKMNRSIIYHSHHYHHHCHHYHRCSCGYCYDCGRYAYYSYPFPPYYPYPSYPYGSPYWSSGSTPTADLISENSVNSCNHEHSH